MGNEPKHLSLPLAELKRYPLRKRELLQAWDSADELLLQYVGNLELPNPRVLILNDAFGALSCGLAELRPVSYTDSYLSYRSILLNSDQTLRPISVLDEVKGRFDLVLLRIPKNLAFFEDQLFQLRRHVLTPQTRIICASMIKHLSTGSFELLNRIVGPTTTSLAKKKARLIFSQAEVEVEQPPSPYPSHHRLDGFEHPFLHHSNLFSRDRLDIGTRFLLEHLPQGEYPRILDLGCGNGIVGIRAQQLNPSSRLLFTDESQMAVLSAQANFARFFSEKTDVTFRWAHSCEEEPENSLDLVLCNPPFHQGTTVSDSIARQMFIDARRALCPGGRLRIVGNSHLHYPAILKQTFGNSTVVAKNTKFTIVDALKR